MRHVLIGLATGLLVVAGCMPATERPASGSPAAATRSPASQAVGSQSAGTTIRVLDFTLEPLTLSLAGQTIALAVVNDGPTVHNVTIRDTLGTTLAGTADLREGDAETITVDLAPGTYGLICTLPGHESLGINGTLTVTP